MNESDGETTFAVTHRQTLIGITGYLSDGEGSAEIGYWLGRPYWGQGFATEAAGALIAYAFRNDACERLTCGHFLDNPASARVIEKLGFVLVGQEDCWCEARKREVPAMRYELPRPRALKTLGQSLANFWSRA